MVTDTTYCDWICQFENCPRHLANLEGKGLTKDQWEHISKAQFTDCPHYGSTEGMYIPMQEGADDE